MKTTHDIDLMAHADGELPLDAIDDGALAKVDAIGELGELVRGHLELAADNVPDARFAAMWREIDKRSELSFETTPAPVGSSSSLWRRLGRWLERYRGYVITGAVSAGAVAALALVLRGPADSESGRGPINVTPVRYPTMIESLDTPGGTGTVFNLKDEEGSTTVIWVSPEDTVEGI